MTAPTIHVAATHAKHIICSPGSGICKQAAKKIISDPFSGYGRWLHTRDGAVECGGRQPGPERGLP
jgi:hypothetical protein